MIYINQEERNTHIEGSAEEILTELGMIVSDVEKILAKCLGEKDASVLVDAAVEAGKMYNSKLIFRGGGSGSPGGVEEE